MAAKSNAQQKAAGVAVSAKKDDKKKSDAKEPAKIMDKSKSRDQLEEMASGGRRGNPGHKGKNQNRAQQPNARCNEYAKIFSPFCIHIRPFEVCG